MQGSPQQVYQPRRVETLVASTPAPSGTATQPSSPSLWSSPFRSSQSVASGPPTPSWRSVSLPERASPPSSPSPFAYSSWNPLEELERSSSPTSSVEQRSVSPFSVGLYGTLPRLFIACTEILLSVLQITPEYHHHYARWWTPMLRSTLVAAHPMYESYRDGVEAVLCCKYFLKRRSLEI